MNKEQNLVEPKLIKNDKDLEWEKYQIDLELAIENH
jgi:hypothetical protein